MSPDEQELARLLAGSTDVVINRLPGLLGHLEPDRLTGLLLPDRRPMNMFGQCGTSTPINSLGAHLPVGLQLSCRPFEEDHALAIALALEQRIGLPTAPDLSGFL
jgi:hypothetical protein